MLFELLYKDYSNNITSTGEMVEVILFE